MAVGQATDAGQDETGPTFEQLESRVNDLRNRGVSGVELVDALVELALKQIYNPKLTLERGTEALDISREHDYLKGEAWALGILGMGQYMHSRHHEALEYYEAAQRLAEGLDDTRLHAGIKTGFASAYLSLGDFEHALEYGIQAIRLTRASGNKFDEAWLHHGISTAYADLGDLDRALEHAQLGHELFTELYSKSGQRGHLVGIARSLSSRGAALQAKGLIDEATPLQEEALTIFRQTDNEIGEARALNDLGLIAFEHGDYETAETNHRASLSLREKIENVQSQSTSLLNLARVFLATNRLDEAQTTLEEAYARADQTGARVRIYQIFETFADVYEALGDVETALQYHRQFHTLREEVMGESATARIKNLQIAFEIERAEREAELIRRKNEELHETNEQLNRLLEELQRAQDRLVQSEKMASLGQLTAGIAHEIKNPLNFVTNFAAMNLELVEELGNAGDADSEEVDELVADIVENTKRILEHGQRADSIIRSMLLHARGGGGEIGSVDFNAFIDEYIKLSYHGFRAQHPDFNVTIHTSYDPDVGSVQIVAGEVGRVILNLANNAFFALDDKRKVDVGGFSPELTVSTASQDRVVEFRIRDNGPGIPDDLKPRIFEPFFTTKAAGEGTGLGLSLSYDIVTQGHGGEMYVESEAGTYTEFVVRLANVRG